MLIQFTLSTGEDVFINPSWVTAVASGGGNRRDENEATRVDLAGGCRLLLMGNVYSVANRINFYLEKQRGESTQTSQYLGSR